MDVTAWSTVIFFYKPWKYYNLGFIFVAVGCFGICWADRQSTGDGGVAGSPGHQGLGEELEECRQRGHHPAGDRTDHCEIEGISSIGLQGDCRLEGEGEEGEGVRHRVKGADQDQGNGEYCGEG